MKKEELTELGLTDGQIQKIHALNGRDIEGLKAELAKANTERDDYKARLATTDETLKRFEGLDPDGVKNEIAGYKQAMVDAQNRFDAQITDRDQNDWLGKKLDEYGVESPYARRQLIADAKGKDSGLTWKDNSFFGFDDFMKAAKEKDKGLYESAEERAAREAAEKAEEDRPRFLGKTGGDGKGTDKMKVPKIF